MPEATAPPIAGDQRLLLIIEGKNRPREPVSTSWSQPQKNRKSPL
jgi:hypothetical protein